MVGSRSTMPASPSTRPVSSKWLLLTPGAPAKATSRMLDSQQQQQFRGTMIAHAELARSVSIIMLLPECMTIKDIVSIVGPWDSASASPKAGGLACCLWWWPPPAERFRPTPTHR